MPDYTPKVGDLVLAYWPSSIRKYPYMGRVKNIDDDMVLLDPCTVFYQRFEKSALEVILEYEKNPEKRGLFILGPIEIKRIEFDIKEVHS